MFCIQIFYEKREKLYKDQKLSSPKGLMFQGIETTDNIGWEMEFAISKATRCGSNKTKDKKQNDCKEGFPGNVKCLMTEKLLHHSIRSLFSKKIQEYYSFYN